MISTQDYIGCLQILSELLQRLVSGIVNEQRLNKLDPWSVWPFLGSQKEKNELSTFKPKALHPRKDKCSDGCAITVELL
ncbi:hypothetical protein RDI58_029832 [Solanum bulbocastanum]|uniref:Uncharacterized protein n=1 Tax=Solanum bulbocastanum TaxID=147425 RepID=A0AAN8SYC6_SOLBU